MIFICMWYIIGFGMYYVSHIPIVNGIKQRKTAAIIEIFKCSKTDFLPAFPE